MGTVIGGIGCFYNSSEFFCKQKNPPPFTQGYPLLGVEYGSRCRWQKKETMRRCRGRKSPRISTECPIIVPRKRGMPEGKGGAVPARGAEKFGCKTLAIKTWRDLRHTALLHF